MEVYEAILKRRSIRNYQKKKISIKLLKYMVNAARLAPSAANLQPLEFIIVNAKNLRSKVYKHLKWAGYIAPAGTPRPGCEPMAYIIILVHGNKVPPNVRDIGAAAENIIIFAQSKGIASCWLGAIDRNGIKKIFSIPGNFGVDSVIALGYPKMVSRIAKFKGCVKYYLDKNGVLHVPKRSLNEVMHINRFLY